MAWDGIIPALQEKKIDVIWSSMTITDERKEVIDFTDMYYDSATVLIGAKSDDAKIDFGNPDSVKGKIFGVQTSTIHANFMQKYFGSAAEVKLYDTLDNALADLKAGRIDYVSGRPRPRWRRSCSQPGLRGKGDLAAGSDLRQWRRRRRPQGRHRAADKLNAGIKNVRQERQVRRDHWPSIRAWTARS